jgi:hypothetical protein
MKFEARMLLTIAVFFLVLALVYAIYSNEPAGILMLFGSVLLAAVPGLYYLFWSHRMDPRPEDKDDGSLSEGAGIIAAFPDSSIWPFIFGAGAALVGLGLVFGIWTVFVGGFMAVAAMVGVAAESRRGGRI